MTKTNKIDTDSLTEDELKELKKLVSESDFFDMPKQPRRRARGADRFGYEVIIEDNGRRNTVKINDGAIPEPLQPLIMRINELVRKKRYPHK